MTSGITGQFAQPAHWRFFKPVLNELADGDLRVDAIDFMERVERVFEPYADFMRPLHIKQKLEGKNSGAIAHYFVFPKGLDAQGRKLHRIVRVQNPSSIEKGDSLSILDVKRTLDERELFGNKRNQWREDWRPPFERRMALTFERPFEYLRQKLGKKDSEWIEDLSFLSSKQTQDILHPQDGYSFLIKAILKEAEDLIGTHYADRAKANFIAKRLKECLQAHADSLPALYEDMLSQAATHLNGEVMDVLRVNPSALSISNYRRLSVGGKKLKEKPRTRLALAKAAPILMLVPQNLWPDLSRVEPNTANINNKLAQIFHTKSAKTLAQYKKLNESRIDPAHAAMLPTLAQYIAHGGMTLPKARDEWGKLATTIMAAKALGKTLKKPTYTIFNEVSGHAYGRFGKLFLSRFERRTQGGDFACIDELSALQKRLATSVLVPKLVHEAYTSNTLITAKQAFYMVGGRRLADGKALSQMPKRLRIAVDEFNQAGGDLFSTFFEGADIDEMLGKARDFATNRGSWNEQLHEMIYTNRLFENAGEWAFPDLPSMDMPNDPYSIVPFKNQAELLKASYETGSDIWREGPRVLSEGIHILAIRRTGANLSAVAVVQEPKTPHAPWQIEQVTPINGELRNVNFSYIVSDYLKVIGKQNFGFWRARNALQASMSAKASDTELMGLKSGDVRERAALIGALKPYIVYDGAWEINADGCFSAPKINAVTHAFIKHIAPHALRVNAGTAAPSRWANPAP